MPRRQNELPPLTSLVVFEAAARNLSLKRAAQELNVTPGAVSKQIKLLEQEVGTALFARGHRSVELTKPGEALMQAIASGFGEIAQTCQRIRAEATSSATISVGSTTAFAQMWLMPRIGVFWRAHQEVTINHLLSDTGEDVPWGRVNLRIRYGDGNWHGEHAVKLFDDRIYPVCSPAFARDHKARSADELTGLPLLQLQGVDPVWTDWNGWFRLAGVRVRGLKTRTFSSYVVALQAAQDGQGLALGWHRLVSPLIKSRKLHAFGEASLPAPHSYFVTWSDSRPLSPSSAVFRDWLIATADAEGRQLPVD
jgi:LysR family transcriptional regulator, glycine cleavage system transcriptional activator